MSDDHKGPLTPVEQLQQKPTEFLIVGIGASAGGIQALQEFFSQVPADSGMAYVVILHLSPDHDSQLAAVLQHAAQIPVAQVTERTAIRPDHVYVVPPDRHLTMEDGYIAVSPNLYMEERRAPVDIFLRTLADQHGPRAISVILSGTGANGSMGLKRIKERGGAVYVQNPREAEFNEMPRNAIATDLVDDVLNVTEIPARIIAYRNNIGTVEIIEETEKRPELQQQALREIFTQLRMRTGHDFSNYKRPTLLRRIERRINVHNLPDLPAYTAFLHENPDENNALLKDLLISVTNFFRDSKAFNTLERDVLPAIFAGKTSADQVRIWVAGCATGEEAYSVAMLCAEQVLGTLDAPKVQIFATDIDESAIAAAREGLYTLNDAADVSPDRLRRFFNRDGDGYRVRREIREMVLFANHNFLKDPPFSKLDLVTCRNVLIYLNGTAQERVIETFHFALKPKGYLFLGTSESVDGASDLFAVHSRDYHIFRTREVMMRSYPVPESVPQLLLVKTDASKKADEREGRNQQRISFGELHQRMLEQYAPPSVVVNEEYEMVHMTERAGKYFEFSGGEPTQNLLKLIRPEIRLELRAALYQAVQNNTAVEARNIRLVINGQQQSLDIHVRPVLEEGDSARGFILIVFKPAQDAPDEVTSATITSDEPVARQLEEELIGLKTQLRNSIEHHEYQAEELKASNEELQAMNEELRSAAEELETSKEELQSINEELRTVNQELKVKIDETTISSNNLQNLINSANIGTIFLDRSFTIRLFTPAVLDIFNLKLGDYGRPFTDITNKLEYDGLLHDAETVLEKLTTIEREVTTNDDRFFLMRLLPYRTADDRINGVVITFFDITQRREYEEALRQSEERMRLLIESAKDYAIFTTDTQRRIVIWNTGAEMMMGYTAAEITGKKGDIIFIPEDREKHDPEKEVENAEKTGRAENERWHLRKDGSRFWGSGSVSSLLDNDGKLLGFVKIMRDLTGQRQMQEAMRESAEKYRLKLEHDVESRTAELTASTIRYSTLIENTPDLITRWDKGLKLVFANTAFEKKAGVANESLLGKTDKEMGLTGEFVIPYMDSLRKVFETGETVEHFSKADTAAGEFNFYSRLTPEKNAAGEVETVLAIARDITEMKQAEQAVKDNQALLQATLDSSPNMIQVFRAVRDEGNQVIDFLPVLDNATTENIHGQMPDERLAQLNAGMKATGIFEHFKQVTETGIPQQYKKPYTYDQHTGWYHQSVVKLNDGVATTTVDITDRENAAEHLRKSEEQLRLFIAASSNLIYQMSADWTEMYALESENFLSNTDAPTRDWMSRYIPAEERERVKAAIDEAISTKQVFELEHRVVLATGAIGWTNSKAVPVLNENGEILKWFGVASDVTRRKIYEAERDRNYILLHQSEKVAGTGSWDYDLLSGTFTWSDGMYRLFNLQKGIEVKPEIYLQHAAVDSLEVASRIADHIKKGDAEFEETLKIKAGETVKVLRVKATVIKNNEGNPVRVLGVDLDITASREAEDNLRLIEAEQQLEIFTVTLRTQEEERRRISESLHNGLGQLLYGIKISMNELTPVLAQQDDKAFTSSKQYTEALLTDAIKESRKISHELMPTVLEEFGLKAAIEDVCEQLQGGVKFNCSIQLKRVKLDKYFELAVYRTAQELILNVVKHAGATESQVDIMVKNGKIMIRVEDNGNGLAEQDPDRAGIGLASIRSKANLLNGTVSLTSVPGKGTVVEVWLALVARNN